MNQPKIAFLAEGKFKVERDGSNTLIITIMGFNTKGEVHEFGKGLLEVIDKQLHEKYGNMKQVGMVTPPPPKETVN